MKKLFSLLAIVLFAPGSFGQSNNPYNELGIDAAAAVYVIVKDYEEGKLKDIDQLTLDYYFKTILSDYPKVKLGDFTNIFNQLKSASNKSIISNSGFSDEAKAFLNKSLTNASITALVDEVKESKITIVEKQNVLSVLAINYNLIRLVKNTYVTDNKGLDNSLAYTRITLIWGSIGFITGNAICGTSCGIFGATIGLILGGYSNDNSGGGLSGSSGWNPQP